MRLDILSGQGWKWKVFYERTVGTVLQLPAGFAHVMGPASPVGQNLSIWRVWGTPQRFFHGRMEWRAFLSSHWSSFFGFFGLAVFVAPLWPWGQFSFCFSA